MLHYFGRIFSVNHKTTWHLTHNAKSVLMHKAFIKKPSEVEKAKRERLKRLKAPPTPADLPASGGTVPHPPASSGAFKAAARRVVRAGDLSIKKVGLFDIVSQYMLTQNGKKEEEGRKVDEGKKTEEKKKDGVVERQPQRKKSNMEAEVGRAGDEKEEEVRTGEMVAMMKEGTLSVRDMKAMLLEADKLETQSTKLVNRLLWYKVGGWCIGSGCGLMSGWAVEMR